MAASLLRRIIRALEIASSLVLAAMMLLTFVDVIGRYLLGAPVFGASEMISTMLALAIFLGLGIANARDRHIVVELFSDSIRSLSPRLCDAAIQGFSVGAACLIAYALCLQALEAARLGSKTVVLEWPLAWIAGAVAALAALSALSQVLGLLAGADARGEPRSEDAEWPSP